MKKYFALGVLFGSLCVFIGETAYDLASKPDGYLYLDTETKAVYASLIKDPDTYKPNSKLIFVFKA